MVLSREKKELSEDEGRLDLIFRALGDQTRRALLARLVERPAMVTELAQPFAMSLPAVSRHIRVLERAGLVARAIDGRVHHCSLSATPLKDVEKWLSQYRRFWEGTLDSLARYVEDSAEKQTGTGRARDKLG
jgi:DNA-binding transcriptional ArsR family regulator